jgi:AraC-like DNA-binding protein
MTVSLAITDFFILALAVQGVILAGLLFYSSRKIKSNAWIGALILIIAHQTILTEIDKSGYLSHHARLLYFVFSPMMAIGPIIYLYARSLIRGNQPGGRKFLHFLPVLLDLKRQVIFLFYFTGILSVPFIQNWYFLPSTQHLLFFPGEIFVLLAFASCAIYSGASLQMVKRAEAGESLSAFKMADLRWLRRLLYLMFCIMGLWLVTIVCNLANIDRPWQYYILFFPAIVFVYWLGMTAYLRQHKMKAEDVVEYNNGPSKTYFAADEVQIYERRLLAIMKNEQLYLNPVLKIDDLAAQLGVSEKAASNLLNQHLGKSFSDFVNTYRVEEARVKLADPALANFTIAAIAFECGFNSLATFQRCFKQITGATPSSFQNSCKTGRIPPNTRQIPI